MRNAYGPIGSADQQLATAVLLSLGGFIAQIAALWELTEICEGVVRPRDDKGVEQVLHEATEGSLSGLEADVRLRVGEAGVEWVEAMQDLPVAEMGVAFGLPHGSETASAAADRAQAVLERLIGAYPDIGHAATFLLGFLDALTTVSRADVMYESIVTAAVSAFHAQLRTIVVVIEHERRPKVKEDELSAAVDRVIGGGFPIWRRWMRDTLGADHPGSPSDTTRVGEVFLRRNLFVHHGGLVSPRYAKVVADAPALGTRLTADAGYTRDAITGLLVSGLQLAVSAWIAFRPTFRDGVEVLGSFLLQRYLLRVRAWLPLRDASRWLMTTAADPTHRDFARVLTALAAKRMGDGAELRTLCAPWHPEQPDLALVRHVLLDEMDEAVKKARDLLGAGQLTTHDLDTWPALGDLREDPRFRDLREAAVDAATDSPTASTV